MTEQALFDFISDTKCRCSYIVRMRIKYDHEDDWDVFNILLDWDWEEDTWIWEWDWDEGQDQVEILGCIPMDMVKIHGFTLPLPDDQFYYVPYEEAKHDGIHD